ncbi:hypothetical protein N7526_010332 [Penicillium atrosanguineum]|nr:hypothetical protein N7526_010332 [Penicillium atrosanguineum]
MLPFAFLAILYRSQSYVMVPESSQWLAKPAELQVEHMHVQAEEMQPEETSMEEDLADTASHKIPLAALTGNPLDVGEIDEADLAAAKQETSDTSPFDQLSPLDLELLAQSSTYAPYAQHETAEDVTIVAARQGADSTDWIEEFCEDYPCNAYIYSLDDEPNPEFFEPYSRKGHEPPYTIFLHGRSEQWHNDIAGPDTKNVLANLRYEAVSLKGYANLRCSNRPGCPSTLYQMHPVTLDFDYEYLIAQMPEILWQLLGLDASEVPEDIGHQCCAQFVLTRERIWERPKSDYIRILQWIAYTDMTDNYGIGWLIEKLWHFIFGMPAVYCVSEEQCRCDLYGWCGPNPLTHNKMLTPVSYPKPKDIDDY